MHKEKKYFFYFTFFLQTKLLTTPTKRYKHQLILKDPSQFTFVFCVFNA